jgi:acetylornithine deacetylase
MSASQTGEKLLAALTACIAARQREYEALCADWLTALIRQRSVYNCEAGALAEAEKMLDRIGLERRRLRMPADLAQDPFYTMAEGADPRAAKDNLVAFPSCRPDGRGRSLILCSHLDVVDASPDFAGAFEPWRDGDLMYGRGAADAKGPIVSILLALKMLRDAGIQPAAPVEAHLVVEEEIGGNGALALIRQRPKADGVVVVEATALNVHPASRGALWFALTTHGVATHMARAREGVNAIEKATEAIRLLREYEARLLAESRGYRQFERYEYPIQLNIGTIHGGVWPSMVPDRTVLEGGIGFLPNKSISEVECGLHQAIREGGDEWLSGHYELHFRRLRNDAYELPADHPLPQMLSRCSREAGAAGEIFGYNASSDARLYAIAGRMPTVVFGPGDIRQAHANDERVALSEVLRAAGVLARFVIAWCG